jgi:hypothetical protein
MPLEGLLPPSAMHEFGGDQVRNLARRRGCETERSSITSRTKSSTWF